MDSHYNIEPNSDERDIAQANNLYDQVKLMSAGLSDADEALAQLTIEYAKDAIELFGRTNQEKKVELRRIVALSEEVVSPDSIDTLKKRAEKAVLRLTYPKNRILRNWLLAILGSILVGAPLVILVWNAFPLHTQTPDKPTEQKENSSQPSSSVRETQAAHVPDGATRLIANIVESDFREEVLLSKQPVLVHVYFTSDPAYEVVAPVVEEVAAEYQGKLKVVRLEYGVNMNLANKLGSNTDSLLLLYLSGREKGRIVGAVSKKAVLRMIKAALRPLEH